MEVHYRKLEIVFRAETYTCLAMLLEGHNDVTQENVIEIVRKKYETSGITPAEISYTSESYEQFVMVLAEGYDIWDLTKKDISPTVPMSL